MLNLGRIGPELFAASEGDCGCEVGACLVLGTALIILYGVLINVQEGQVMPIHERDCAFRQPTLIMGTLSPPKIGVGEVGIPHVGSSSC